MKKWYQAGYILAAGLFCMVLFTGCVPLPGEEVSQWIQEAVNRQDADDTAEEGLDDEFQNGRSDSNREEWVRKEQFGSLEEFAETEQILSISEGNYAYECLPEEGKKVYDQMLAAILNYQEKVNLATTDKDLMREAYQALNCDYGGLFWVDGYIFTSYTKGDELIGLAFSPNYVMDEETKNQLQKQVDEVVEEWLGGISVQDSDYAKAKYVFETLIENVDYVEGAEDNQNILSVFLNRQTVCQGYACATQYLLRYLGVQSIVISGRANNQAHAWNIVNLDGNFYHMDTTWGNSRYLDTDQQEAKFVNYIFLCMTDEEIAKTHLVEMPFVMPECTAIEDNYYVREGRYFEVWDPDAIGSVFRTAWENGADSIDVKCGDFELYEQLKEYFIREQGIADYCSGIEYVYYMESPEYGVFIVNFNKI